MPGYQRVEQGKTIIVRCLFHELWIVLHGTRTKRIHTGIKTVVHVRKPGKVPYNLRLA